MISKRFSMIYKDLFFFILIQKLYRCKVEFEVVKFVNSFL